MKTLKQHYIIDASIDRVWKAMVDPERIEKWSGEHAIMSERRGSLFRLFGGDIFGKNIEVLPFKKLVQEFYGGEWDLPSTVTFTLVRMGDKTVVDLLQEEIPEKHAKEIESYWERHYMGPMIRFLER